MVFIQACAMGHNVRVEPVDKEASIDVRGREQGSGSKESKRETERGGQRAIRLRYGTSSPPHSNKSSDCWPYACTIWIICGDRLKWVTPNKKIKENYAKNIDKNTKKSTPKQRKKQRVNYAINLQFKAKCS